jgi:hypothetical protein
MLSAYVIGNAAFGQVAQGAHDKIRRIFSITNRVDDYLHRP